MTKKIGLTKITCNKCGKTLKVYGGYNPQIMDDELNDEWNWMHEFKIDRPGYPSKFDGIESTFHLCDDCLYEFYESFAVEPERKNHLL